MSPADASATCRSLCLRLLRRFRRANNEAPRSAALEACPPAGEANRRKKRPTGWISQSQDGRPARATSWAPGRESSRSAGHLLQHPGIRHLLLLLLPPANQQPAIGRRRPRGRPRALQTFCSGAERSQKLIIIIVIITITIIPQRAAGGGSLRLAAACQILAADNDDNNNNKLFSRPTRYRPSDRSPGAPSGRTGAAEVSPTLDLNFKL